MEDAAVVTALMAADRGLFFEDGDAGVGEALAEAPSGGEADDAAADDYDLLSHFLSRSTLANCSATKVAPRRRMGLDRVG
jgi:hypothetical protein